MEPQVKAAHVYAAITAVRAALAKAGIKKSRENEQGPKFMFRGIDDMYNAVSSLLAEHGLCIMPSYSEREQIERQSAHNKPIFWTSVRGSFAFVSAVDGSSHTVVTYGEALDSSDKSTNKAMSAAMKYAIMETFTIPTEGDNDADSSTHDVAAKPFTDAEKAQLKALHDAAAEGMKPLKAAWQKLDVATRDRLRGELDSISELARKNDAEKAKAAKTEEVAA